MAISLARKAAFDLFTDPNPNLNWLNGNDDPFAAIINVPEAPLFRVVYRFGSPISMLNPMAPADLFSLIGELEDAAVAPSAMRIPLASLQTKQLLLPSDEMIRTKAANWPNTWPKWKVNDVTVAKGGVKKEVLMVAPVPFFTVVDGLDSDIHAIDMLERLSSLTDAQTEPYIQNAIKLVTAALVKYNATGDKPYIGPAYMSVRPDAQTRKWAKQKLATLCPNMHQQVETVRQPQQQQHSTIQLLLQQLLQQQNQLTQASRNQQSQTGQTAQGQAVTQSTFMILLASSIPHLF